MRQQEKIQRKRDERVQKVPSTNNTAAAPLGENEVREIEEKIEDI